MHAHPESPLRDLVDRLVHPVGAGEEDFPPERIIGGSDPGVMDPRVLCADVHLEISHPEAAERMHEADAPGLGAIGRREIPTADERPGQLSAALKIIFRE